MADLFSSLNIKTETDGDVKAVLVDGTTPANKLAIDANGQITMKALAFDGTSDVPIPVDPISGGVKVDIVDASGLVVNVDVVTQVTDNTVIGTEKGMILVGQDGTNYQFIKTNTAGQLEIDVAGFTSTTPISISNDGNANTALNPIFVSDVGDSGNDIHIFGTSVAVAAFATHTTSYTVGVGVSLFLEKVRASASGQIKVELQIGGITKSVGFNSASDPQVSLKFDKKIGVATGTIVDVIVTNRESTAMDLYAEINGETL